MTDDFDGSVRSALEEAARQSQPSAGLADRLLANARAGRVVVSPIARARRGGRWTLPLLAAAAVVVIAGGTVAATQLVGDGDRGTPAAPGSTTPVVAPTHGRTPTRNSSSTGPAPSPRGTLGAQGPRPHHSSSAKPAPTDFTAASVYFRDESHGYAFGLGDCKGSTPSSCRVTLVATADGGDSWRSLTTPKGLVSMFPDPGSSDGSCMTNGDVLGPCVDHVAFANADDGYLYGLHGFYWTTDGGRSWSKEAARGARGVKIRPFVNVPTLVLHGRDAYRIHADYVGSSGGAGRLQHALVGTDAWTDISPALVGIYNSKLAVTANAIVLAAGTYEGQDDAILYRSTTDGRSWAKVARAGYYLGLAAAANGQFVLTSHDTPTSCSVRISDRDGVFGKARGYACPGVTGWYIPTPGALVLVTVEYDRTSAAVSVSRSTDGGVTFTHRRTFPSAYRGDVGFVGGFGYLPLPKGRLEVTTDGGLTWQRRSF